jgi:hypothetical protein
LPRAPSTLLTTSSTASTRAVTSIKQVSGLT